jgi:hypothetical protein
MPCDTRTLKGQSITERKQEVREAVAKLSAALVAGNVKAIIGPTGAIAFPGWAEADRGRVSDACAFRLITATGSALAKQAIARAEQLAGRSVNRQAVAHGHHSHDGGETWHHHK